MGLEDLEFLGSYQKEYNVFYDHETGEIIEDDGEDNTCIAYSVSPEEAKTTLANRGLKLTMLGEKAESWKEKKKRRRAKNPGLTPHQQEQTNKFLAAKPSAGAIKQWFKHIDKIKNGEA